MGSGPKGPYTESQPYSHLYSVEKSMHQKDIKAGIYHDGHYDRNPTAKKLNEMISGNYIGDKHTNIIMPYVIDKNGDIIVGKRNGNGRDGPATPHPTLIGGRSPKVQMAGMLYIQGGKIIFYDANSGHYKPNIKSMAIADKAFGKLPTVLFKRKKDIENVK